MLGVHVATVSLLQPPYVVRVEEVMFIVWQSVYKKREFLYHDALEIWPMMTNTYPPSRPSPNMIISIAKKKILWECTARTWVSRYNGCQALGKYFVSNKTKKVWECQDLNVWNSIRVFLQFVLSCQILGGSCQYWHLMVRPIECQCWQDPTMVWQEITIHRKTRLWKVLSIINLIHSISW